MKKTILFIGITLFVFSAKAQTVYVPSGTSGIGTSSNANVGIGTSTPEAKLSMHTQDYDASISSTYPTASSRGDIVQFIETSNNGIEIGNGRGVNDRKAWILARHTDLDYIQYGTFYSTLHLQPNVGNKTNYMGVAIGYGADTSLTVGTHLAVNGKVGIGTTAPDQLLTVNGKIHAQEVIIDLDVPVADYVFAKDYKLMPISDVEKYVQENSHLPEIPSAEEVKGKGLSMGEMQNKMLQKVEELTLYIIQQDKKIQIQNEMINSMKDKLDRLESKSATNEKK